MIGEQTGFLVTVVAENWAMESQYVIHKDGAEFEPFTFKCKPVSKKVIQLLDENGDAISAAAVSPSSRKDSSQSEDMLYAMSADVVAGETDDDGKIVMSLFETGDTAKLTVDTGEGMVEVEFKVNDKPEQAVTVKKKGR